MAKQTGKEHGKGETMKRLRIGAAVLLGCTFVLFFVLPVQAAPLSQESPTIRQAMAYFKASQKEDGGFGQGGITEWVMMAISSAGEDPRRWYREGKTPLDALRKAPLGRNPYDWIRMALVLASIGENPRDFHGVNCIQKIKGHYRENQFGDPLSLRDDYWALLALAGTGERECPEAQNSVRFILKHQNPDGSWSASTTGVETCADNTAIAILSLVAAGVKPDAKAIRKGLGYLRKVQSDDGGYPYLFMPSNAASDAWVLQALWATDKDPVKWKTEKQDVFNHLLGLQQKDGSFRWTADTPDSSLMMTAYAVPALLGKRYPLAPSHSNLATVDIRVEGENRTIFHTQIALNRASRVTALSVLAQAAQKAGVDYKIEYSGQGGYLKSVAREEDGWQYRVNDRLPMLPADQWVLKGGEEVVWFFDIEGCKSPLRTFSSKTSAWAGENILFRVEQFDDDADEWRAAEEASFVKEGMNHPAVGGNACIHFEKSGIYVVYAEKKKAIRSIAKKIVVEDAKEVTVDLKVEDNGIAVWQGKVSYCGMSGRDMNGHAIDIRRPVLFGSLEAARKKGGLSYEVIYTAEGLILASINNLSEDNQGGSWWFKVNGEDVLLDGDEYEVRDGDSVYFYRSKHPKASRQP